MKNSVVICGFKRSPMHFANKGDLAKTRPDDMAAEVVKALIADTGVNPDDIEDLIMGCAFPEAEQGFNIAKLVVQNADLPVSIAGATVNRFCGSSMTSIHIAAGAIQMGAGEAFICAGVESMSRIPMGGFNPLPNPALFEKYPQAYIGMGETAENLAKKYDIKREAQEEFAFGSHKKAAAAAESGKFDDEIVPFTVKHRKGDVVIDKDEFPRETTLEKLGGLRAAFKKDGTVTAGNASGINDGAAAVLLMRASEAAKRGLTPLATIKSFAHAGVAPQIMGTGPIDASRKALAKAGWDVSDLDLIESNEAFAAQALSVSQELDFDMEKVNVHGGAIALGHPIGASGARVLTTLLHVMKQRDAHKGLATLCIGGGMGIALTVER